MIGSAIGGIAMIKHRLTLLYSAVNSEDYYRSNRAVLVRTGAKIAALLIILGLASFAAIGMVVFLTIILVYPSHLTALVLGLLVGLAGWTLSKHIDLNHEPPKVMNRT